jgi:hypothetical protein
LNGFKILLQQTGPCVGKLHYNMFTFGATRILLLMVIIVLFLRFIIDIFDHNARLIDDVAFTFNMLARNYGFMPNVDNFSCIVDKLGLH